MQDAQEIVTRLSDLGQLIFAGLLIMLAGVVVIYLLYRLVTTLVNPEGTYSRLIKVAFGATYAMILVLTVIVAAEKIGLDVSNLSGIAILVVLVGAVLVFFLIPFLPRLPFVVGDLVEIKGTMGNITAITTYHTMIRTFNGQQVFMPNALIMASPITNYSANPTRRVVLDVQIHASNDIERARALLLGVMSDHANILSDPAPSVFVTAVDGEKASLSAYSWAENANWFGTRDALWVAATAAIGKEGQVSLALPQLEVALQS